MGDKVAASLGQVGRRASEVAALASSIANPYTRRVAEAIASATNKDGGGGDAGGGGKGGGKGGGRRGGGDDDDGNGNGGVSTPFGFLDSMCGPVLRNLNGQGGGDDDGDLVDSSRGGGRRGANAPRRGRSRTGRRPTSSYDYDDETYATDATGSRDEDDDTGDDTDTDGEHEGGGGGGRKGKRGGAGGGRGRDRKPRGRSPPDSPSEMMSEYDDDDATQNDTVTEASSAVDVGGSSGRNRGGKKGRKKDDGNDNATKESEKLITQPLASGFAKRCYFTKAGIGRATQHYEGLTLTGNTVLMLASAMKLKGCPTICDEDLRRVEQTYPNQFSRLPDELLLSSGWRRISKYCHFSHKPLPDGVPFFHSRKRCHANGGFYFLLCSAVGMTRLMDVEPLTRDALVVLQTDFPMTCDGAPASLMNDPDEWTLVNKFCFFSGGPINVEEDVYYRAELGGTEIYMLAFLSPSLSPEELYRLRPASGPNKKGEGAGEGEQEEESGPLKSVAAVEEVESVYDLTDRDFDDLKLYHLGPCRALPPYLLNPDAWAKVLPSRFLSAREEAMAIALDYEGRFPSGTGNDNGNATAGGGGGAGKGSGYVELGGAPSTRSGAMPTPPRGGGGPDGGGGGGVVGGPPPPGGYPPQYPPPGHMDPNAPYNGQGGYPPQQQQQHPHQYGHPSQMDAEMNYYHDQSPGMPPPYGNQYQQQQHMHHPQAAGQMYDPGQQRPYAPQHTMGDPHWRDVQEEGAFGSYGGNQPHDEALAPQGGMYEGMNGVGPGGMMHPMGPPMEMRNTEDPPDEESKIDDNKSTASGTSFLMGGAQNRLKQKKAERIRKIQQQRAQRPDLSTKLSANNKKMAHGDDSTWDDTRTDGESSYGTSFVSGSSYTDTTNPNERNSRRALILQMAKARMKNGTKERSAAADGAGDEQVGAVTSDELMDNMAGLELD